MANCYGEKLERLRGDLDGGDAAGVGLAKGTSNLFRRRAARARPRVDLSRFNEVLTVDPAAGIVECEAMTTYAGLVEATLALGVMPCVVPQLKSITLGGATVGVGIESSSFRYGLVHRSVCSADVLLADGSVVCCTPDNEYSDLFHALPNSYGTLGYVLKLTARVVPVQPYVELTHIRHRSAEAFFADLAHRCRSDADFVDGTVFAADEMYITVGRFTRMCPYTSDYTFRNIYYRSIRERSRDYLTVANYLWRWDTDWFWCSKNLYAQNPVIRRLLGPHRLNSVTYQKVMRWNDRWGVTRALSRLAGEHAETVIQDIDIPIGHSAAFLEFLLGDIGILPVWICPIGGRRPARDFTLYPLEADRLYVNFGFWDTVRRRERATPGEYNRKVERRTRELGGVKSLYSDAYYSDAEFWEIYDGDTYFALKRRYDPRNRFPDLYEKCVLRR